MSFFTEIPVAELEAIAQSNPSELEPRLVLIRRLAAEGEVAEALDLVEESSKSFADNPELMALKAMCQLSVNETEAGYELLQIALRRSPGADFVNKLTQEIMPCFLNLAPEQIFDPKWILQQATENKQDKKFSENFQARLDSLISLTGLLLDQGGGPDEIIAGLKSHLHRFPDDINAKLDLARYYNASGDAEHAETHYQEVVAADPLCAPAYFELATLVGDVEQALQFSRKGIDLCPDYECGRVNLGAFLFETGSYSEAVDVLRRVPSDSPFYVLALWNIVNSYRLQSNLPEASAGLEKIVALTPDDTEAWDAYGCVNVELQDYENALKHFDRVIEIDSENVNGLHNRAIALGKLMRHEEAIQTIKYALVIDPDHAQLLISLANLQSELGELETAIETLENALKRHPEEATMWLNLGSFYCQDKRLEKSLQHSRKCLEIDPSKGLAYWNIACVYAKQNDKEECYLNLKQSIELSPQMAEQIMEDKDLQPFLDDPRFTSLAK